MSYQIIVDSAIDFPDHLWDSLDLHFIPMSYEVNEVTTLYVPGINDEEKNDFYQALREKAVASTSQITPFQFEQVFTPFLDKGIDVLYAGFSSGISSTYGSSEVAANNLRPRYPERKIICLDTHCGSAGLGMLVQDMVSNQRNGMSLEDNVAFFEREWPNYGHFFMVNDLMFLVRGGRVSTIAGIAGAALGMKPLLLMEEHGELKSFKKARGVKGGLEELTKLTKLYIRNEDEEIWITYSGKRSIAEQLGDMLKKEGHQGEIYPINITPIIGAHVGPDFVSIFYRAKDISCRRPEGLKLRD